MKRRKFLKITGFGTIAIASTPTYSCLKRMTRSKPNIVLIMADDMGFSDIGCYGGEIHTPNLNNLAQNGLRFTQFYNTSRCCPTRASLMTGLYPHQTGMGNMVYTNDQGAPGYRGTINHNCVTIAEVLKTSGYRTYMTGKWHLTFEDNPEHWPLQRGFDHYFGTIKGAGSYYNPASLQRDNEPVKPGDDFYYTDAISDNSVKYIQEHHKKYSNEPFFLYVAYTAPHWPLHAKQEDIKKYRGSYRSGWDQLRRERYARQIQMGIVDERWPLSPRFDLAPAWDTLDEKKKDEMNLRMSVYAAQVDCMDQGIGRIIRALKDSGSLENTLIMFLSDNGACAENSAFGYTHGNKNPMDIGKPVSDASYGFSWANASNTPFRLFKWWVHEGGIATPLIVHWPLGIKSRGDLYRQPAHVIDIMATCLEISGAVYPKKYNNYEIIPLEGKSLLPAFHDNDIPERALFWEHVRSRAIRDGKWKLVTATIPTERGIGGGERGDWELYDLEADRTELKDLARKYPQKAKELKGKWEQWARASYVLPEPNIFKR